MDKILAVTRDPGNRWHGTAIEAMVITYNPEFKGSIAHADPARSGSAFMALVIQLMSMGGDNETGWNYMSNFVENLEGKDAYKGEPMHRWS
jgi:iron(III) transport system substrate-binding protein